MTDDLEPQNPEEAGVSDETPELAQLEPAHLLANDARPALEQEGFSEEEILHWAETYVANETGTAEVDAFIHWIKDKESNGQDA